MELRIYASDPAFPAVAEAAEWLAKLKNAHLFHDLKDIQEVERLVGICDFEDAFEMLAHEIQMGRLMR